MYSGDDDITQTQDSGERLAPIDYTSSNVPNNRVASPPPSLPPFHYSFPQQQYSPYVEGIRSMTTMADRSMTTMADVGFAIAGANVAVAETCPPPIEEEVDSEGPQAAYSTDEFYQFCKTLNAALQESRLGTQRRMLLYEANDAGPKPAAAKRRRTVVLKGEIVPQTNGRSPAASVIKRALLSVNGARVFTHGLDVVTLLRAVYGSTIVQDDEIPLMHTDLNCVRAIVDRVLKQCACSVPPTLTFNGVYRAIRSLRFGDHETRARVFHSLMNRATALETQWLVYLLCGCGPLQRTADMYVTAYASNMHSWLKTTRQRYLKTVQEFRTYWNAKPHHIMISARPRGTRRYQVHYERGDRNDISEQSTGQTRSSKRCVFATRAANGAKISIFGLQHTGFINVSYTVVNELELLLAPIRNAIIEIDHFTTQQTRSSFVRSDVNEYHAIVTQIVPTSTNASARRHILCHCVTIQDCYFLNDRDMRDLSIIERTRCFLNAIDRSPESTASAEQTAASNAIWANDKCEPNSLRDHAAVAEVLSSLHRSYVIHSSVAREQRTSDTQPMLRLVDESRRNETVHYGSFAERYSIDESHLHNDACIITCENLSESTINSFQAFRVMMAGVRFDRYFISMRIFRPSYYVKDVKITLRRATDDTRFVPCMMAIVAGWSGTASIRVGPILVACRSRNHPIVDTRVWRTDEWIPICVTWNALSDEEKRTLMHAFTSRASPSQMWCRDYIAKYFPENPPQMFMPTPSCFVNVKFSSVSRTHPHRSDEDAESCFVQWPIAYDLQVAGTETPRDELVGQVVNAASIRAFADL